MPKRRQPTDQPTTSNKKARSRHAAQPPSQPQELNQLTSTSPDDSGLYEVPTGPLPVANTSQLECQSIDPLPIVTANDLDIHVSQQLKDKIWNFEYVDLTLLLEQNISDQQEQARSLSVVDNQLVLKPLQTEKKVKAITHIETWTTAFLNYTSILIQRHPQKAPELIKYMSVIRDAAVKNKTQAWVTYDQQFRLRIARDPSRSWTTLNGDLWLRCFASGNYLPTTQHTPAPCFDYNFQGQCNRFVCSYSHVCIKCGQNHPSIKCQKFVYSATPYSSYQIRYGSPTFPAAPGTSVPRSYHPAPRQMNPEQLRYRSPNPLLFNHSSTRTGTQPSPRQVRPFLGNLRNQGPMGFSKKSY